MLIHESADTAAAAIEPRAETPNQVHGRLLEGVHLAGYTFERACQHLEWLLDDGRWRQVGAGYDNVNAFLAGIRLDEFRIVAEQRKRIATRIKELQPEAQNTKIAKMLGVDEGTIRNDTSENSEPARKNTKQNNGREKDGSENSAALDAGAARRGIVTGVSMHSYDARGLDCYETPAPAVRALLTVEQFDAPLWEPACGPGAIVRVLRATGHKVVATDIADYGCEGASAGVDFLTQERAPAGVRCVLTNPPYRYADEFVRHALMLVPRVVMLLRFAFYESAGRADILDSGHLARVHVFTNRLPMVHRAGWEGPKINSSAFAFAWYVWDRDHRGPTTLDRITWEANGDEAPPVEPESKPPAAPAPPGAPADDDDGLTIPPFLDRRAIAGGAR